MGGVLFLASIRGKTTSMYQSQTGLPMIATFGQDMKGANQAAFLFFFLSYENLRKWRFPHASSARLLKTEVL